VGVGLSYQQRQPRSMRQSRAHLPRRRGQRRVPAGVVQLKIGASGQQQYPPEGLCGQSYAWQRHGT
jgi:hypothetical protein